MPDGVETGRAAAPAEQSNPNQSGVGRPGVPPVVISSLTKRFGSVTAVDSLSFEVHAGRVTGFLGPNGAGKTTTMRMLLGLVRPTSGTARFGDLRYADPDAPQRRVGAVLEAAFHPGRTGRNHLRVLAATAGADDARVDGLLTLVELSDAADRRAGGYSLGMRQRLALAGALLGDPDYLILDEPANGLDPEGIRWLRTFLRGFAADGRVVLVSSHLLGEVQATADDLVVINRGRLLRRAAMADLDVSLGTSHLRSVDLDRAGRALAEVGIESRRESPGGPLLQLRTTDLVRVGKTLFAAGVEVHELARDRFDLEESFFGMLEAQR